MLRVSFFHHIASDILRLSFKTFNILIFSETKLCWNGPCLVPIPNFIQDGCHKNRKFLNWPQQLYFKL